MILRKLYNTMMGWAAQSWAPYALFFIAIIEAIVFPIPPDVILIGLVLARPKWAWFDATVCTVGSVIGGVLGYMIGYYYFDLLAEPVLNWACQYKELYCPDVFLKDIGTTFEEWGVGIVLMASVSIFPYKLITLTAGLVEMNLPAFMIASFFGRGLRFFIIAALLYKYGAAARHFIEKHLIMVFTVLCVLVLAFFTFRYIM